MAMLHYSMQCWPYVMWKVIPSFIQKDDRISHYSRSNVGASVLINTGWPKSSLKDFSALIDQLQSFLAGVLRGAGRQTIGAVSNFGSYWLFGVPLGVMLATAGDMGALGYWIGLVSATFAQLALYVVVVFWCTQWENQAVKIHKAASLASSVDVTSRAASTACQHSGRCLSVNGNQCS